MKTFEDLISEIMASESHQAFMNDPNQLMEVYVPEGQSEGVVIVKSENNIYICPTASKPVKVRYDKPILDIKYNF